MFIKYRKNKSKQDKEILSEDKKSKGIEKHFLEDNETGRKIENPYILVKYNQEDWAFLNTTTFRKLYRFLIIPIPKKDLLEKLSNQPLYEVYANIGKQEYISEKRCRRGKTKNRRIGVNKEKISSDLIGYLPEKTVKKKLPQTYHFFIKSNPQKYILPKNSKKHLNK